MNAPRCDSIHIPMIRSPEFYYYAKGALVVCRRQRGCDESERRSADGGVSPSSAHEQRVETDATSFASAQ